VVDITVTNSITLNSWAYHTTGALGIPDPKSGYFGTVHQKIHTSAADPCQ